MMYLWDSHGHPCAPLNVEALSLTVRKPRQLKAGQQHTSCRGFSLPSFHTWLYFVHGLVGVGLGFDFMCFLLFVGFHDITFAEEDTRSLSAEAQH